MKSLWAITCYFNPGGYRRRLQNYLAFRRHLTVPLVAVELAYHDDIELPPDAADILIRLRAEDVLWQKERLLNLALGKLPQHCDNVAWLDGDVVFERDDWAEGRCVHWSAIRFCNRSGTSTNPPRTRGTDPPDCRRTLNWAIR